MTLQPVNKAAPVINQLFYRNTAKAHGVEWDPATAMRLAREQSQRVVQQQLPVGQIPPPPPPPPPTTGATVTSK
jgi:hypothetical protein